jgi:hypothetical protein
LTAYSYELIRIKSLRFDDLITTTLAVPYILSVVTTVNNLEESQLLIEFGIEVAKAMADSNYEFSDF